MPHGRGCEVHSYILPLSLVSVMDPMMLSYMYAYNVHSRCYIGACLIATNLLSSACRWSCYSAGGMAQCWTANPTTSPTPCLAGYLSQFSAFDRQQSGGRASSTTSLATCLAEHSGRVSVLDGQCWCKRAQTQDNLSSHDRQQRKSQTPHRARGRFWLFGGPDPRGSCCLLFDQEVEETLQACRDVRLLERALQNTFSSCESCVMWPHANIAGMNAEFHCQCPQANSKHSWPKYRALCKIAVIHKCLVLHALCDLYLWSKQYEVPWAVVSQVQCSSLAFGNSIGVSSHEICTCLSYWTRKCMLGAAFVSTINSLALHCYDHFSRQCVYVCFLYRDVRLHVLFLWLHIAGNSV